MPELREAVGDAATCMESSHPTRKASMLLDVDWEADAFVANADDAQVSPLSVLNTLSPIDAAKVAYGWSSSATRIHTREVKQPDTRRTIYVSSTSERLSKPDKLTHLFEDEFGSIPRSSRSDAASVQKKLPSPRTRELIQILQSLHVSEDGCSASPQRYAQRSATLVGESSATLPSSGYCRRSSCAHVAVPARSAGETESGLVCGSRQGREDSAPRGQGRSSVSETALLKNA